MKKTLIVLMMVLLAAMLITSCDNKAKELKTINITYNLGGGKLAEGETNPATATEGDTVTLTAPAKEATTESGVKYSINDYLYCDTADVTTTYTFKGWKVEGTEDSTAATTYTAGTEDVKLVAVWEVKATGSNCSATKLKDTVAVGTEITLGYYYDALKWKVLAVDKNSKKALLLASEVVSQSMKNNSSESDNFTYAWGSNSPIYQWFNNTGSEGFISQCRLKDVSMVDSNAGKVFLLSKEEVETNLPNASERICSCWWWLRTGGTDSNVCLVVNPTSGSIFDAIKANTGSGVRPAFWISL